MTVPDLNSDTVRIKVVVHDGDGNTGSDASDTDNEIIGTMVPGDVTGDGHVGVDDLLAVIADWGCADSCTVMRPGMGLSALMISCWSSPTGASEQRCHVSLSDSPWRR